MSETRRIKEGITLKELSVAFGASLDSSNLELEKIAKGPVNYAVSRAEFSIPVKEITIDGEKNVIVALPKTPEEMVKAQYVKVNVEAVPRVTTPKVEQPSSFDAGALGEAMGKKLKDLFASVQVPEKTLNELVGRARLILESSLADIKGLDEKAVELLVKAAGVDSVAKLADADIKALYSKLSDAIGKKLVTIPESYEFTMARVESWVLSARRSVRISQTQRMQ